MEDNKKIETKRIWLYLGITFALSWGFVFGIIYPQINKIGVGTNVLAQIIVAGVMFFPAIGVLLTRLITKEGFKNSWLNVQLKGKLKYYLFAYFGPTVLTAIGCVIYFLIFPEQLDLSCGYFEQALVSAGADISTAPIPLPMLLMVQAVTAIFFGPVSNFITCFGEEWGWRGYLLPKMYEKMSPVKTLLVTGVIWGVWHAPLTALGHNYGMGYAGFPFTGIFAMCIFCIVLGTIFSYLTLKTGSCIPAVLAHGAVNSFSAIGVYLTSDGGRPFMGPAPTGLIGGIAYIVVALVLMKTFFMKKEN